jgi:hypothetical protein
MRFLQNFPHLLELAYQGVDRLLNPFQRWLVPGGWIERFFVSMEIITKVPIFDCRMCGHCVLHSTAMTCPMTCPKTMRNGPCGGVQTNGHCEICPDMVCIWLQAWQRSGQMVNYQHDISLIQAPLNNQLVGTSAWINHLNPQVRILPKGWEV